MKKKFFVFIIVLILVIVLVVFIQKKNEEKKTKELVKNITEHYNKYVKTNKDSKLYNLENKKYIEYGTISKGANIVLEDTKIDKNAKYFKIEGLDLYIGYSDVDKTDEFTYNDRYKKYIPFNSNIKTKSTTSFYDEDNNLVYSINKSYDFEIIVKDTERKGIEFNNQLLYVKDSDIESTYEHHNTDLSNKKNIRTITYHFFYKPELESCNSSICVSVSTFEQHLKYISDNGYLTLRLPELELYMDGKIQIPEKSTVLTIDDGTIVNLDAIKLLDKYETHATMFLITSVVPVDYFVSDYLDLESHTDNMHNQYECPGYGLQGGGILCLSEDYILNDLRTSQEKLGGSKYLAYPFFDWNDRAIRLLKEAGFQMAFVGAAGADGVSTPGVTDKYKIKRKTMFSDVDMNEFINEFLN